MKKIINWYKIFNDNDFHYYKNATKQIKKKFHFNFKFISLLSQAIDSNFRYCLLIKK